MVSEIENEFHNYDQYNAWGPVYQVTLHQKRKILPGLDLLDFRIKTFCNFSCFVNSYSMLFAYNAILLHVYFVVYIMLDTFIFLLYNMFSYVDSFESFTILFYMCDLIRTCMLPFFIIFIIYIFYCKSNGTQSNDLLEKIKIIYHLLNTKLFLYAFCLYSLFFIVLGTSIIQIYLIVYIYSLSMSN